MIHPFHYIKSELQGLFSASEISTLTRLIISEVGNIPSSCLFDHSPISVSDVQWHRIEEIVRRLKANEPIQYILGSTEFFGLPFRVTPDVLIPRPETEELVEWILQENAPEKPLSILDIGTGSGCIPIALAKKRSNAIVHGWDISEKALQVAEENAKLNNVDVLFSKQDIFAPIQTNIQYDIIVSNPPYVLEVEKSEMESNVIDYEPHIALFVPNDNPLLFYERIAEVARQLLKRNGELYFEINRKKGKAVEEMLQLKGFSSVELRKDLSGNERMIRAIR